MKRVVKIIFVSILSFFLINLTTIEALAFSIPVTGTKNYDYASKILELVNKERANVGAQPLKLDKTLSDYAMTRAGEIVAYYSHTRPNGESCFSIFPTIPGLVGENIAISYSSPESVMEGWMNSEGHRENILEPTFNSIGIGAMKTNNVWHWVQVFSSQKSTNLETTKGEVSVTGQEVEIIPKYINYTFSYPANKISDGKIILNKNESIKPEKALFVNTEWPATKFSIPYTKFTYKITDSQKAQVKADGTITALEKGTTELIVSLNGVEKRFPIEIKSVLEDIEVENQILFVNEEKELVYKLLPATAPIDKLTITSDDENIVKIVNNHLLALKAGSTKVTITIHSKTESISKTIDVIVKDYKKGDINSDTKVDLLDVREALAFAVGKHSVTDKILLLGDMDINGKMTSIDATQILKIYLKKA